MLIVVDVETDGTVAGIHSMIEIGAIAVPFEKPDEFQTFYTKLEPLPQYTYESESLAVTKRTHEQTMGFGDPADAMHAFDNWLRDFGPGAVRDKFTSDNPGFDWSFINLYLNLFTGENVFGHRQISLPCNYTGMRKNILRRHEWKKYRRTKHTHNPLDDCMGVVEALYAMKERGLVW